MWVMTKSSSGRARRRATWSVSFSGSHSSSESTKAMRSPFASSIARVAVGGLADVLVVTHVADVVALGDVPAAVGRRVVDHDDLVRLVRLREDALDGGAEEPGVVAHRDHDADQRAAADRRAQDARQLDPHQGRVVDVVVLVLAVAQQRPRDVLGPDPLVLRAREPVGVARDPVRRVEGADALERRAAHHQRARDERAAAGHEPLVGHPGRGWGTGLEHDIHVTEHEPEVRPGGERGGLPGELLRVPDVVLVQERQQLARRRLDPGVARRGHAPVLLPQERDRVARRDLRAAVGRAVVDHDDLDGVVRLLQRRLERRGQEPLAVEDGDDDADERHRADASARRRRAASPRRPPRGSGRAAGSPACP